MLQMMMAMLQTMVHAINYWPCYNGMTMWALKMITSVLIWELGRYLWLNDTHMCKIFIKEIQNSKARAQRTLTYLLPSKNYPKFKVQSSWSWNTSHTLAFPFNYLEANTEHHVSHDILLNGKKRQYKTAYKALSCFCKNQKYIVGKSLYTWKVRKMSIGDKNTGVHFWLMSF